MKKILFTLLTLSSYILFSQVPENLNYQAVARNLNGVVISNQFISIQIIIHDGSPTATIVYQEIDTATTNQFGLFTVAIGSGQVQVGADLSAINWATGNKYLQVGFNQSGANNNFTDMGTTQLLSVPYALYAAASGSITSGGEWSDYAVYTEEFNSGDTTHTQLSDSNWTSRQLNHNEIQVGSSISLTGNNITLQPGTYHVSASAQWGLTETYIPNNNSPAGIGNSELRLHNVTNNSTPLVGQSQHSFFTYTIVSGWVGSYQERQSNLITIDGVITIPTASAIALEHYITHHVVAGCYLSIDAGKPINAGEKEVYARILIQKVN